MSGSIKSGKYKSPKKKQLQNTEKMAVEDLPIVSDNMIKH